MRKTARGIAPAFLFGGALIAALMFVPGLRADEQEVTWDQIPEAARAALSENLPGAQTAELSSEEEDGRVVYEASTETNDLDHSVKVDAEGNVIEAEQEVAVDSLPETVTGAVETMHPGAQITEAERVTEGEETNYELRLSVNGMEHEVIVSPKGEVTHPQEEEEGEHEESEAHERSESMEHMQQAPMTAPATTQPQSSTQTETPGQQIAMGCDCTGTHQAMCTCTGTPSPVCHCHD
jgi:hypothetical protein